jgi:hypothetical protein
MEPAGDGKVIASNIPLPSVIFPAKDFLSLDE